MDEKKIKMQVNAKDIATAETMTCPKCGCKFFKEAVIVKMVPGILVGTADKKVYAPIPVMVCNECGALAPQFAEDPKYRELLGDIVEQSDRKDSIITGSGGYCVSD